MGWLSGPDGSKDESLAARDRDWETALARGRLPGAVEERLRDARAGRTPWVAAMTPAELLAARSHGVRPIATVSGTCWMGYGYSWTEGHAAGWATALDRIRTEALAAGANAVVDVQMRTIRQNVGDSMDFTLLGTAVRIEGLAPSRDPVIATVPALEFVRLLEMGIVPTGIAVGARFEWLGGGWTEQFPGSGNGFGFSTTASDIAVKLQSIRSQPISVLTDFWEAIRRDAIADMRAHAATLGNGVLAHTNFGELRRIERDKQPTRYLGRHIVVGTVIDTPRGAPVPHGIEPVVDMRDGASPFARRSGLRHGVYPTDGEEEGPI